jgi:hypothetical protein
MRRVSRVRQARPLFASLGAHFDASNDANRPRDVQLRERLTGAHAETEQLLSS